MPHPPAVSGGSGLSSGERHALLTLAREAVVAVTLGRAAPRVPDRGRLAAPGAAFVSLHRFGELRGCIGCLTPQDPTLGHCVARMAVAAAQVDPRFSPVGVDELDGLVVEISVLGPMRPVRRPDEIGIGRDGLCVEHRGRRGVLLPQVAADHGWDARRFLEETCLKAHLPPDAWREGASVQAFTAEVFSEAG